MGLLESFLLSIGLAMDAFAVSLAVSSQVAATQRRLSLAPAISMVLHFGVFQAGMAILGWTVGLRVSTWITALDHWIAFGLLLVVGVHMIREGRAQESPRTLDVSRWSTILTLAVATSIDALAVGLGLAFVDVDIHGPSVIIGVVTAALSAVGVMAGRALGAAFGERMQIVGGFVLLFIGTRILVTHLMGA